MHVIVVGVMDCGVRTAHGGDVAILVVLQCRAQIMAVVIPVPEGGDALQVVDLRCALAAAR